MTATLVFSWHFSESPRSAELCSAPVITCVWSSFKPKARVLQNRRAKSNINAPSSAVEIVLLITLKRPPRIEAIFARLNMIGFCKVSYSRQLLLRNGEYVSTQEDMVKKKDNQVSCNAYQHCLTSHGCLIPQWIGHALEVEENVKGRVQILD